MAETSYPAGAETRIPAAKFVPLSWKLVGLGEAVPYVVLTLLKVPLVVICGVAVEELEALSWILSMRLFPVTAVAPETVSLTKAEAISFRPVTFDKVITLKFVSVRPITVSKATQLEAFVL